MKHVIALLCLSAFVFSSGAQAYCASRSTNSSYEYIKAIAVNDDVRVSGNNGGYLSDTKVINLKTGSNTLKLTPGFPYGAFKEYWAVWIDQNRNDVYEINERVYAASSNTEINASINIPATALAGNTGMRVAMRYGATPSQCSTFSWGEVEDYVVHIEYPYHLSLSYDFTATRTGKIGDNLTWVVERDGAIVLERNAMGELSYRYFNNFNGSHYRIWLKAYISGAYRQVSNIVEYAPGITNLYQLSLGDDYLLQRSGYIGDPVQWVIEKDGAIVLERSAESELDFTYFDNVNGAKYRVWLQQFTGSKIVSNTVEYVPGAFDDYQTLTLGDNFEITRTGELNGDYIWVIEKDGAVVLRRSANGEMSFTYDNNASGGSYRVWLEKLHNGAYVVASNIVLYRPAVTNAYTLTLGPGYQVTRSGNLGDNVQWVIEKNGVVVLQRYAANELSYTYYSNTAGSTIRIWLQKFINGYYEQISNIVTYNP